jgi:hypothetical protein
MALKVVPIPAVGAVGSRPRKEPLYDTERYTGGVAPPTSISLFNNFSGFANPLGALLVGPAVGGTLTKTFSRDTNLSGQQGLPAAHHHYWFAMRCKIRSMECDLSQATAARVPEQINRLRELSAVQFRFASSELFNCQLDEIPSGTGPQHIATTHTGVTAMSLPSGIPSRNNAKDVTISGKPVEIVALESFRVDILTGQAGADPLTGIPFALITDLYLSVILEGLLLRGITG